MKQAKLSSGFKEAISSAVSDAWDDVLVEVGKHIECEIQSGATLVITDGNSGDEFCAVRLSKIVTLFMAYEHDEQDAEHIAESNEALALELEKQAKRLRARASAIRRSRNPANAP